MEKTKEVILFEYSRQASVEYPKRNDPYVKLDFLPQIYANQKNHKKLKNRSQK